MANTIVTTWPAILGQYGTWSPVLQGASDNPVATYSTQFGEYFMCGRMCFFTIRLVTTTMTKTTTTDQIRISLPIPAANATDNNARGPASAVNGTPVQNADRWRITAGSQFLSLSQFLATAAEKAITYAAADPGIGVLTNTITIECSGWYRT